MPGAVEAPSFVPPKTSLDRTSYIVPTTSGNSEPASRRQTEPPSQKRVSKPHRTHTSENSKKLSRIVELNEAQVISKASRRSIEHGRKSDASRRRGETTSRNRNQTKASATAATERSGSSNKPSASHSPRRPFLTSSDGSSGSNSTPTQASYNQKADRPSQSMQKASKDAEPTAKSKNTDKETQQAESRNVANLAESEGKDDEGKDALELEYAKVFDYLVKTEAKDCGQPFGSLSPANYILSDASTSEGLDTPSSTSTLPSPMLGNGSSTKHFQTKLKVLDDTSRLGYNGSRDSSTRTVRRQPRIHDTTDKEEPFMSPLATVREADNTEIDRPFSWLESTHLNIPDRARGMTSLHRQRPWPSPSPRGLQAVYGNASPVTEQRLPGRPTCARQNKSGFEMLAQEFCDHRSSIEPLYRSFEYLRHRALLSMQEELCDLEQYLRALDEDVAQLDLHAMGEHNALPPRWHEARRDPGLRGTRAAWLDYISVKLEEYDKAMSTFKSMEKDAQAAMPSEISALQHWREKHAPLSGAEGRFLEHARDIIVLKRPQYCEAPPFKEDFISPVYFLLIPSLVLLYYSVPEWISSWMYVPLLCATTIPLAIVTEELKKDPKRESSSKKFWAWFIISIYVSIAIFLYYD